MNAFDTLHPALQHHIVNSLGWRELRPFQEQAIPPILAGQHALVLAPTAGGKTEAAFFPILSRMLSSGWTGLSVLYICPIKALLNNLDLRLQRYCTLLGRRSALWHGDVKAAARRQILRDPPDCLLTTPESLEVMLVSRLVDRSSHFGRLQAVIVDEIHAFAGDDRGWHLLAVLERVSRLAGRELQRVGLSATVGNPDDLIHWLTSTCNGTRAIIAPAATETEQPDVQLDYVGSLSNAATVIARLHRGDKRLVFVDSRSRAEELAAELGQREVNTFVMHSSLSQEQRRKAEHAFAAGENCVVVATSALELGVDVGDLDRVIQIDAPGTVSSFLQRMGRTGRRPGTRRNCLFLATTDDTLLQAAALIDLWASGFVEPVIPPPEPLHILAQQFMALALQESGIGRSDWRGWIGRMPGFAAITEDHVAAVLNHMISTNILWDDDGILWFGRRGEDVFGSKHFMALLSVFTSEPLFAVRHGRSDLGFVHHMSFAPKQGERTILLLGGRNWVVNHLDWQHRTAYVEPTDEPGRSRWLGMGQPLHFKICQTIRRLVATDQGSPRWSQRAGAGIEQLRLAMAWAKENSTALVREGQNTTWWTFAGAKANGAIAARLGERLGKNLDAANLNIAIQGSPSIEHLHECIEWLKECDHSDWSVPASDDAIEQLKFSACLPAELARRVLETRLADPHAVQAVLNQPVRFVE